MVDHLLVYHPAVQKLKDLVDEGALGQVFYLYGNRQNLGIVRADENALWSLGPHDISVMLHLVGERPSEVSANGESYLQPGVEDVVFSRIRFPSGVIGHLHLSWLDPHKMRKMTVIGSERMVVFDDMETERKVTIYDKGPIPRTETYGEYIQVRSGDIHIPKIDAKEPLRIVCERFVDRRRRPGSDAVGRPRRRGRGGGARGDERVARVLGPSGEPRDGGGCMSRENLVLGEGVEIGADVEIGANVVIHDGTRIGDGVVIQDNVVLGKQPKLSKRSTSKKKEPLAPLEIGAGAAVCSGAVVYAGTILGPDVIIGDQASVRERCTLGEGVVVGRGVCVENDVPIGAFTKIQSNSYITAYSELEDHVFIAPCVTTTNDNFMGRTEARHAQIKGAIIRRGARVGGGVVILPGIEIGAEAFVAAGALVTRDVPPGKLVAGLPAQVWREVPAEEMVNHDTGA